MSRFILEVSPEKRQNYAKLLKKLAKQAKKTAKALETNDDEKLLSSFADFIATFNNTQDLAKDVLISLEKTIVNDVFESIKNGGVRNNPIQQAIAVGLRRR